MTQYRKLHTKVLESLDVGDMPDDFTRLFWILLPLVLCREGRGIDRPEWLQARLFPMRRDVTDEMLERGMAYFVERGMVIRYGDALGRSYFQVVNWHKYQGNTGRERASPYPAPDGLDEEGERSGLGEAEKSGSGEAQMPGFGEAEKSGVGEAEKSGVGEAEKSGFGEAEKSGFGEAEKSGFGEAEKSGFGEKPDFEGGDESRAGAARVKQELDGVVGQMMRVSRGSKARVGREGFMRGSGAGQEELMSASSVGHEKRKRRPGAGREEVVSNSRLDAYADADANSNAKANSNAEAKANHKAMKGAEEAGEDLDRARGKEPFDGGAGVVISPQVKKRVAGIVFPKHLDDPAMRRAWEGWEQYQWERGEPLSPSTRRGQLKRAAAYKVEEVCWLIDYCVEKGWRGLQWKYLDERRRKGGRSSPQPVIDGEETERLNALLAKGELG